MPKGFESCVKRGGKVRTLKPKGKKSPTYIRTCRINGKSFSGEVKHRKKK